MSASRNSSTKPVKGGDEFPEDEKAVTALFSADRTALRELFSLPAVCTEDVWLKV